MSKLYTYKSIPNLVTRLRSDLKDHDHVLLFAYNGTGKTRLSMAFKDAGKKKGKNNPDGKPDTLYFNAFTEDLFSWDNDLDGDATRHLRINSDSQFFSGLKELNLEDRIFAYLTRYANIEFKIDYDNWRVTFSRTITIDDRSETIENIKVSRGEENLFIWCVFLAICEVIIDGEQGYQWVKHLYIDDPISSLDDNNAIALATDLAHLLQRVSGRIKVVISTHHGLFFNVMSNEMKSMKKTRRYFLECDPNEHSYTIQALPNKQDTPFLQHVAAVVELQQIVSSGKIYNHHFNMLRNVMEKTAIFYGFNDFSSCIRGIDDEQLYARALNIMSHGKYSIYEPKELVKDNKELFRTIFSAFLAKHPFDLSNLASETPEGATP